MGERTGIAWTDRTYNPWVGCTHVSPGCDNCYMFSEQRRYGNDPAVVRRTSKATFNAPLKWKSGRVFTCSWSDFFIADADEWRADAWDIIRRTPHLTYQILTKRPVLIKRRLPSDWGDGWPNVWLGVSVENQDAADARIPILLETPAVVRFLSVEPLLSRVDLRAYIGDSFIPRAGIDWAIIGGESGNGARPCNIEWVRSLVEQCRATGNGLSCFVKQLGAKPLAQTADDVCDEVYRELDADERGMPNYPFIIPLRQRKGDDPTEWPEDLRVREFPRC